MKPGAFLAARGNGFAIALLSLVSAVAIACASVPRGSEDSATSQMPVQADSGSLTTILATKDLRVGTQRVSFLLTTPSALVKSPTATVTTRRLD